jgi:hypothetical protein
MKAKRFHYFDVARFRRKYQIRKQALPSWNYDRRYVRYAIRMGISDL